MPNMQVLCPCYERRHIKVMQHWRMSRCFVKIWAHWINKWSIKHLFNQFLTKQCIATAARAHLRQAWKRSLSGVGGNDIFVFSSSSRTSTIFPQKENYLNEVGVLSSSPWLTAELTSKQIANKELEGEGGGFSPPPHVAATAQRFKDGLKCPSTTELFL